MGFVDQRFQAFVQNMRVDLHRHNVGVPQHLLQGPEVRPVGQKGAGKRMAKNVPTNGPGWARTRPPAFEAPDKALVEKFTDRDQPAE